jgi:hypothetical protein
MSRWFYRAGQFWRALFARPRSDDLAQAARLLPPDLLALFQQMQPGEQAHSLQVMRCLQNAGQADPDLLTAALLHDVGKICYPLWIWERVLIVLGCKLLPAQARRWGQATPAGWRRAFVVAAHHPQWGAELAAKAGASPRVVALIGAHQGLGEATSLDESTRRLLTLLQQYDDES